MLLSVVFDSEVDVSDIIISGGAQDRFQVQ